MMTSRMKVTHGRHCPCTACANQDWTIVTGPCGMHGKDCPALYAPYVTSEETREDVTALVDEAEAWIENLRESANPQTAAERWEYLDAAAVYIDRLAARLRVVLKERDGAQLALESNAPLILDLERRLLRAEEALRDVDAELKHYPKCNIHYARGRIADVLAAVSEEPHE